MMNDTPIDPLHNEHKHKTLYTEFWSESINTRSWKNSFFQEHSVTHRCSKCVSITSLDLTIKSFKIIEFQSKFIQKWLRGVFIHYSTYFTHRLRLQPFSKTKIVFFSKKGSNTIRERVI